MASFGHVAVGLACARVLHSERRALGLRAAVVFSALALWPDVDAVAFAFGVPYSAPFGHRGATHSLVVAAVVTGLAALLAARARLPLARTTLVAGVATASHGLLDTMTYGGGRGCALLWPFSNARLWAPSALRFIPIAPIGAGLLSRRGLDVVLVEVFLFSPLWIYALWPRSSPTPRSPSSR